MAGEARAEIPAAPAPAPPPPPVPHEKRVVPGGDGREEERPEPKRRRACVAALDGVPCAASVDGKGEGEDGRRDGSSFSFHHAGGGFVALETTPKFGSFNPPTAAEREAPDPKPAPHAGEDSPREEEEGEDAASVRSDGEGVDGNSQLTAGSETSGRNE